MKIVCGGFTQMPYAGEHRDLLQTGGNSDLQQIAASFIKLQNARHDADYDLSQSYTRAQATALVQQASDSFVAWKRIQKTSDANVFLLSLLMQKRWDRSH